MGEHRADGIRAVLSTVLRDLEIQRNGIALSGQNLEDSVGKLKALGEWKTDLGTSIVLLDVALPKDLRNAVEKYDRAIEWLRQVYAVL